MQKGASNAKILLLVDADSFEPHSIIKNYNKVFQDEEFQAFSINFTKVNKKLKENSDLINSKAITIWGEIGNQDVKQLLAQEYEFIFQFFNQEHLHLNYLMAKTKSTLRIGFEDAKPELTDLSIKTNREDLALFFNEAKKYLQIIKKSA